MSAALLSAALLSGCASVPMADATADAQAKQFVALKDAANLYIYRNETFGTAVKMPVLVDGSAVGDTVAHSYILIPPSNKQDIAFVGKVGVPKFV